MIRKVMLTLFILLLFTTNVSALSWAYPFVVWNGNVYEVKQDEVLKESEIGSVIGKVSTKPNEYTGRHFGNASNYYDKGTEYYKINETPTNEAIAVKHEDKWVKAVFAHKAPFHIMNILLNRYFIGAVAIIVISMAWIILKPEKQLSS